MAGGHAPTRHQAKGCERRGAIARTGANGSDGARRLGRRQECGVDVLTKATTIEIRRAGSG
jgi:hypothetical protein